jgi:hypothetical protein
VIVSRGCREAAFFFAECAALGPYVRADYGAGGPNQRGKTGSVWRSLLPRSLKANRALQTIVPLTPELVDPSLAIATRRASQTGVLDSTTPTRLLHALLLQVLYSVCSKQLLMEQLDCIPLFRGVAGLNMDDPVCDLPVLTKYCECLLAGKVAQAFFDQGLEQARERMLLSDERFPVDRPLMEAGPARRVVRSRSG